MNNWDSDDELGEDGLGILALSMLPTIPGAVVRTSATLTWRVTWASISGSIRSPAFTCPEVPTKWRLVLYPRNGPGSTSTDSVSIFVDRGDYGKTTSLPALCVQFCIVVSQPGNPFNFIGQDMAKRMESGELLCGFTRFCSEDQIVDSPYAGGQPILSRGDVDITVVLRIMYDLRGNLWSNGVPAALTKEAEIIEQQKQQPAPNPIPSTSHTTSPRASTSRGTSSPVASTSRAAEQKTQVVEPETPKPKPLPPSRAAYPGEECMICADEPLLFPTKPPTSLCTHEARICLPCLQNHISNEMSTKGAVRAIVCPAPECIMLMDYDDLRYWADENTFRKYDRMLARMALGVEENFVLCTNAACDAGQIHSEGANAPIVTCYVCHHKTCFLHQVAWHEGLSCEEYDEEQRIKMGMATTKEYLKRFTKACPNCKKPLEKSEGCDAMLCKPPAGCGHRFCWLCLAPYDIILRDGNHRHYSSCKYYAPFGNEVPPSRAASPPPAPASDVEDAAQDAAEDPPDDSFYDTPDFDFTPAPSVMLSAPTTSTWAGTSATLAYTPRKGHVASPSYASYSTNAKKGKKWYHFWKET